MGIKDQELEVHLYLRAGNDLVLWLVLCNMKSMWVHAGKSLVGFSACLLQGNSVKT